MAQEGMLKCREQFDPLLAQSRKITADAAEYCHPLFGAETAGDLLLDFDHAKIALRLVVVKRDRKIMQEPEHGPLAPREAIQQIARWALFGSPWCALRRLTDRYRSIDLLMPVAASGRKIGRAKRFPLKFSAPCEKRR